MKEVRIGFFIETESPGGAEKMLVDLASYVKSAGYRVVLMDFGSQWLQQQARDRGFEYQCVGCYQSYKSIKTLFSFARYFASFLKQHKIALLHSHLFGPITAASLACRLAKIPNIGTLHDVYMLDEHPLRIRQVQIAALLGCKLVSVSQDMEAYYRSKGYFTRRALKTIYNGVDLQTYGAKDLDQAIDNSRPVRVCCVGRLVELKQVDKVITAVQVALAKGLQVELTVIGDGPERAKLEDMAAGQPPIHFAGMIDNVSEVIAEQDIFVQFSTTEGLSLSILEAAAIGLAVIVSNVGGNAEIVPRGAGVVLDKSDYQGLADAIVELASDSQKRQSNGRALQQHIAATFERSLCCDQYLSMYRQLLTSN